MPVHGFYVARGTAMSKLSSAYNSNYTCEYNLGTGQNFVLFFFFLPLKYLKISRKYSIYFYIQLHYHCIVYL